MARTYGQHCALAAALDLVGDRWTLLIVRELLVGPARYADLRDALPGMATNLLAERLRALQAAGLVERQEVLRARTYVLTDDGRGLEDAVAALIRWGDRHLDDYTGTRAFRPQWLALAAAALARPGAERLTCELTIGDAPFALRLDAPARVQRGPAPDADAALATDPFTLYAVATGQRRLEDAVAAGDATARGDVGPLARAWTRLP